MKLTLHEFKSDILPGLAKAARDHEDLRRKAALFIDGNEVLDAEGNRVEASQIDIVTMQPDEDDDEQPIDEEAVKRAVDRAMRSAYPDLHTRGGGHVHNKVLAVHSRGGLQQGGHGMSDKSVPAIPRTIRSKVFKDEGGDEAAFRFGNYLGAIAGDERCISRCKSLGVPFQKTLVEGTNSLGGYLVPEEFEARLVNLAEQYGVVRQRATTVPMTTDSTKFPRQTSHLVAKPTSETGTMTEQDINFDQIELNPKKWSVMVRFGTEIEEDAAIALSDILSADMARAFAHREDKVALLGNGASFYQDSSDTNNQGMIGVLPKLLALDATPSNIDGIVQGTSCGHDELSEMSGKLPEYAVPLATWLCNRRFKAEVFDRLTASLGGATAGQVAGNPPGSYMGFPIVVSQVMPDSANDVVSCLLVNLNQVGTFGVRRGMSIMRDESRYFTTDEILLKATARWDYNCHDVGTASEAGPVVGFMQVSGS